MAAILPVARGSGFAGSFVTQRTAAMVSAGRILNRENRSVVRPGVGPDGRSTERRCGGSVVAESWFADRGAHWNVSARMTAAQGVLQIPVPCPRLMT